MELELIFNEEECRRIYEPTFILLKWNFKVKKAELIKKIFISILLSMLFALTATQQSHQIMMASIPLMFGAFYMVKIITTRSIYREVVEQNVEQVDLFVKHCEKFSKVLYKYDDIQIKCYENGDLTVKLYWNDVIKIQNEDDFITLLFNQNSDVTNLIIFRKMTNENAFQEFRTMLENKFKDDKEDPIGIDDTFSI